MAEAPEALIPGITAPGPTPGAVVSGPCEPTTLAEAMSGGSFPFLGSFLNGGKNYAHQITLGGDGTETAAIGKIIGPSFKSDEIIPAIERLVMTYLDLRTDAAETFLTTFRRLGPIPFKTELYTAKEKHHAA